MIQYKNELKLLPTFGQKHIISDQQIRFTSKFSSRIRIMYKLIIAKFQDYGFANQHTRPVFYLIMSPWNRKPLNVI